MCLANRIFLSGSRIPTSSIRTGVGLEKTCVRTPLPAKGQHGQDQDWISCRILVIFLDQEWIWIFIFEKNGSGQDRQDQDICLISKTKFS